MFTIEQIKAAHAKVRSGADFPSYIQDLIGLGVTNYETYVSDGHTEYHGAAGYNVSSDSKYDRLTITLLPAAEQFKKDLKAHQQGRTDYLTFCKDCARSGVEKWIVSMQDMTCTYFDTSGNKMLTEEMPQ